MAACIVCNQQTLPGDVQDVSDVAKLHSRLEKVLDEAVPQDFMMCASCQFDLAQIEMYYALLIVFKKRYSGTAKQRLQSIADDTGRNILHETADSSSENLRNIFGAVPSSESSTSHLPLPDSVAEEGNSEISTAGGQLEIFDVRTVKEEFPDDTSSNNTEPIGTTLDEHPQPIAFPILSPVVAPRKLGRPGLNEEYDDVSPLSLVASPRKRGRPRRKAQMSVVTKRRRPKKNEPSASVGTAVSAVYVKKQETHKKLSSVVTYPGQAFPKTSAGGGSEIGDLVQVKVEVHDPTGSSTSSENTVVDGESALNKKKQRKPKKDQDPSYDPLTHKKKEIQRKPKQDEDPSYFPVTQKFAGQRRPGRPRKDEPQPPFTCPICNKVFNDRSSFTVHSKRHTDERPHVCSECGKAFKDTGGLRQHMRTHTLEKVFKCTECTSAFISRRALVRHSLVHTESRPFPCNQCEKKFKSQERLRVHIRLEHVQGRKFLCNICGLATYTVGNLRVHILTHSEVKPFQCQTCGKRCSTKLTLQNHELTHSEGGRPKHLCPICGKTFVDKSNLAPHIRQHTGESQHHCTICNKSYTTGSIYRRHMLTHQDQRPHQCSECGKGFTSADNLKQHMKSHSDERPFKCPCGSAFRQKDKLQKHMRSKIHAQYEAQLIHAHTTNATEMPNVRLAPPDSLAMPNLPPMGLLPPIVVAPQPIAPPVPIDRPVPLGVPLVIESQHEQLYTVAEETGPVYLGLCDQEAAGEDVP